MVRILLVFVVLGFSSTSYACDCSPASAYEKNVRLAYKNSDLVILGSVKSVDEDRAIVEILENFKGDVEDSLIIQNMSSCSVYLESGETWLLYLDKSGKEQISNQCLPNRLFPKMNILSFPPPTDDSGKLLNGPYLNMILLNQELISLRQEKLLSEGLARPDESDTKGKGCWIIIIVGLCVNTLLLVVLLFKRR